MRRRRCLANALATRATAIFWPMGDEDAMLGRDNVEALGFILTDDMQRTATAGTGLRLRLNDDFNARQMIRQITALAAMPSATRRSQRRALALCLCLRRSGPGFEILKTERHLFRRKFF